MPRSVFNASIFHLSPFAIEYFLRDDTYRTSLACTPFQGGILLQCDTGRRGGKPQFVAETEAIMRMAPANTTHLYVHEDAPILELSVFDRDLIRTTFRDPPFYVGCDDSEITRGGSERLQRRRGFSMRPRYFKNQSLRLVKEFQAAHAEFPSCLDFKDVIDTAYTLACGAEDMKLMTDADWSEADVAFETLGKAMDILIDDFNELYSRELQYTENILLATRARIARSLRTSPEWRESSYRWRRS